MIIQTLWGPEKIEETKSCYVCKEVKPFEDFAHRAHRKDGTRETKNICKSCNSIQVRRLRELKKQYNKPDADYKCPICKLTEKQLRDKGAYQGHTPSTAKTIWVLDHCHKTGRGREYICDYCNKMIAQSFDTPSIMINGAKYLEKHNV